MFRELELYYNCETMDLSNTTLYDGQPPYPDDKTGMAIPFAFLNYGPENTKEGMMMKWQPIKKNRIYVGVHGA
ncbi:hypothetical protein ANCDUO_13138, partial [Ancylostoma duodenale]